MIIEICATSIESLINAQKAGANRIELCENYLVGGVTPSKNFTKKALINTGLPINILIRPREGNFIYTNKEIIKMKKDIEYFKELNVKGFVIGMMNKDYLLVPDLIKEFREITYGFDLTFHRAFDFLKNKTDSLEFLIENGFDRILCSGHSKSALIGIKNLLKYKDQSDNRISIMPGGGINPDNFKKFKSLNFSDIHLSAINMEFSPHSNFDIIKQIVDMSK